LQLFGCAGPQQASAPIVAEDRAAAELVELFGDADTSTPESVEPVAEPQLTPFTEEFDELPGVPFSPLAPMDAAVEVYHWDVISGGAVGNFITGVVEQRLRRPVAVAARGDYIYIVDAGLGELLRYDQVSGRLTSLLDLDAVVKGEVADIFVTKDHSFYITDTDGGRVLQYDQGGRLVQVFSNYFNLTKPVAVNVLESGDVVVADGHFDHLLHFSGAGELLATYGGRGVGAAQFLNITSMALGPDGFYVGARVGRRLQVMSLNGDYSYAFEEGRVVFPTAIAVDRNNRSYVADMMDNQIKVFDRGRLLATIGGAGAAPGKFMRITDMWLDERFLYIVDSLNGRIQVARLVPEGLPGVLIEPAVR
jgi:hypothetical protein